MAPVREARINNRFLRRVPKVRCIEHSPFDDVSQRAQRVGECLECFTLSLGVGWLLSSKGPQPEFSHILNEDLPTLSRSAQWSAQAEARLWSLQLPRAME